MILRQRFQPRRGAVLPLVAICMIALIGLMALAIDVGMVAVARSQCQNAADTSAMAGARTVNGQSVGNYNLSAVPVQAVTAAAANQVMGQFLTGADPTKVTTVNAYTFTSGPAKVEVGTYAYVYNDSNPSEEAFLARIPRTDTTEPYSAVRTTITQSASLGFGRIFGMSTFNASATATAVHRPRDVMIIMDLSGSMRFQSLAGTPMSGAQAAPSSGGARTKSLNPESIFPQYGHYSDIAGAALQGTSTIATTGNEYVDPNNISSTQNSGPPICDDFYSNPFGVLAGSGNKAFTRAPDSYNTAPGGDDYLKTVLDTSSTYAKTVADFNNGSTTTNPKWETLGYKSTRASFNLYTQGPGYWGKTFWIWPPAPRGSSVLSPPAALTDTSFSWHNNQSNDWRQRFFVAVNTSTSAPSWVNHNTILFDSTGLMAPGTNTTVTENGSSVTYTYRINYAAILYWLSKLNPTPFPTTLQAGRIRYYTTMPDGTDTKLNNRWWTTATTSLPNDERFWKEYIDFVLGFTPGAGANSYNRKQGSVQISALIGNGDYFTPSGHTFQITQRPQPQPSPSNPGAPYMSGTTAPYQTGATAAYQNSSTAPYITGTTGAYQTSALSAAAAKGATTVSVTALGAKTVANQNYVTFGGGGTSYKVTNSSKTSLNISPGLSAALANGATIQVYSSSDAIGATSVSVSPVLSSATIANSDYVGFKGSTANTYKVTNSSTSSLSLGAGLVSAINLSGDTVQIYASNGSTGSTNMSVSSLPTTATIANSDYVGFKGSTANLYKVTNSSKTYLSLGAGLASAVNLSGDSMELYASNGAVGALNMSVTGLSSGPTANSDYVGFKGSATNVYKVTTNSTTYLAMGSALATAVNVSGDTTEIYPSNGAVGATKISVTGLSQAPTKNRDYVVIGGDTSNPALIIDYTVTGSVYILTVSALTAAVNINGATVDVYSPYMDYSDNPVRPRHQFWFGPMTMVDWLGNYNLRTLANGAPHHWWPGNCHEAHAWACKVGIQTAIDDIQNNHPSDFVGLTFFSNPMNSVTDSGHHNRAVVPLGRNYQQLKDSLFFPPSTVTGGVKEIGPYDADMNQVPRSDGGTAPGMGFMIAYNQFSSSTTNLRFYAQSQPLYRGDAGGLGRKGANCLVIFETDGAPNTQAFATLVSQTSDSYYPIRVNNPQNLNDTKNVEWPASNTYASSEVYDVVKQITALNTASPPGYSTTRKKVLVYSIGYGSLFDPANAGTTQTNALTFLQSVQFYGNTASDTDPNNFPATQKIYGPNSQRISNMQAAFTNIMQSGVQVSLIE